MRKILFLLVAAVVGLLAMSVGTSSAVPLNEKMLRENMATRIASMIQRQSGGQADLKGFGPGNIKVLRAEPVKVAPDVELNAVKLAITRSDGRSDEMVLITDSSGTVQFNMVTDIKTGDEAVLSKTPALTKIDFPSGLSTKVAVGKGKHDVVFVSDPFCPFCRDAFKHLLGKLDQIRELKIAHLPLPMHPGAEAASWVMHYAHDQGIVPFEVVKFAYEDLKPVEKGVDGKLEGAQRAVVAQFVGKFPKLVGAQQLDAFFYFLKGKYEGVVVEGISQLAKMDFKSTPMIIIDGQVVSGFQAGEIDKRLAQ